MGKYLPGIRLASAIAQLIDFATKILSSQHAIYRSPNGAVPDNHALLQDIANNLYRLTSRVKKHDLKSLSADKKSSKPSEVAQQFLKLADETTELTNPLIDAILVAQERGSQNEKTWSTAKDALLTVWKQKEISVLEKRLGIIRKEVDTALLFGLRQHLDKLDEAGLVISIDDPRADTVDLWQAEALNAIHTNDWKAKNKKHVEQFSQQVDALILAETEAQFCSETFANLHFVEQDDFLHSIPSPLDRTCEWIFGSDHQKEGGFLDWLGNTNGQNLFWITGKPGSGKSTLMKHLFRNERLFPYLENWSGYAPGILTGYFLWNCGNHLQKTALGLLRALLYEALQDMIYGPLEQDPDIFQWIFRHRWNEFTSYGGGLHSFTLSELRTSLDILLSDTSRKYLFMIDGLDEIDDSLTNTLDVLLGVARRQNVKICVSSRPSPVFHQAFEKQPKLEIEQWTQRSILSYVLCTFDQNDTMFNIPAEQSDGTEERAIINMLVEKASGMFLWASLATEFLVQSTSESDDVSTIRDRVDGLPYELDDLLSYIFDSLETPHLVQASRLIRLLDVHGYPSLLPLCFATDPDPKAALSAETRPLSTSEVLRRVEQMRNVLQFKCKKLLSIFEATPPDQSSNSETTDLQHFKVNYSHRCIRDFIQSGPMRRRIEQATGFEALNSDAIWARANLWAFKTLTPKHDTTAVWNLLADAMELALRLETATKRVQVTYLDTLSTTFATHLATTPSLFDAFPPVPAPMALQSFLDIAVWLNLSSYLAVKAKSADRKDLRHAIEYAKEARKRLGAGGEAKWLGGRERMREGYARVEPEIGALLEYYSKSMKFKSQKPILEEREWV